MATFDHCIQLMSVPPLQCSIHADWLVRCTLCASCPCTVSTHHNIFSYGITLHPHDGRTACLYTIDPSIGTSLHKSEPKGTCPTALDRSQVLPNQLSLASTLFSVTKHTSPSATGTSDEPYLGTEMSPTSGSHMVVRHGSVPW